MSAIDQEINELLHRLSELLHRASESQFQRFLELARDLDEIRPRGIRGDTLISFGGCIPADDLKCMQDAIEEGCEAVNLSEW